MKMNGRFIRGSVCLMAGCMVFAACDLSKLTELKNTVDAVRAAVSGAEQSGAASSAGGKNLLVNGDAEDGLNGWEDTTEQWITDSEAVAPYSGKFFLSANHCDGFYLVGKMTVYEPAAISQEVPVSEYRGKKLVLSAFVRGNDIAFIGLHDDSKTNSAEENTDEEVAGTEWRKISTSIVVPPDADKVVVTLYANREDYLSKLPMDVYFDNVTLTVEGM